MRLPPIQSKADGCRRDGRLRTELAHEKPTRSLFRIYAARAYLPVALCLSAAAGKVLVLYHTLHISIVPLAAERIRNPHAT